MPFFLILIYPFLEILSFSKLIEYWGWGNTILWVIGTGLFGISVMVSNGRTAIMDLQANQGNGVLPTKMAHKALIFAGGFLIFLPGLITDAIGIVLILPGTRHLLIAIAKVFLVQKLSQAAFRVFSMGKNGAGGFVYKSYSANTEPPQERDVTVVDVKPIEVTHQVLEKKNIE